MALPILNNGRGAGYGLCRRVMLVVAVPVFGLVFPALALFGGSTNLINWGPGLLFAGAACLLMFDKDRRSLRGGLFFSCTYLAVLGLLLLRARHSPDVSAAANNTALIALAAGGFLIGSLAGVAKSRALFTGLSLVMLLNLFCTVMQKTDAQWNLIYPERSVGLPSGLFAHYSYSAAFCLGALGLLTYRACNERSWFRGVMIAGAVCALATIPISPSRGGNLALALMVAAAGALLLARAFSKSKPVLGIWLPAAALVLLVLIFAAAFVPLIDRGAGPHGFYNDGVRLGYWNAAAQIAASHPWLGGGAGNFATKVYLVLDDLKSEPAMVHNEALQLAVGYGYPALAAITALMLVPLLLSCWRFVNQTDKTMVAMAALGLVAMLFQSNFESIFHCAPGVFIAALILGRISRSLWGGVPDEADQSTQDKAGGGRADIAFLIEIKDLADAHAGGSSRAISKLAGLLAKSKDEQWRRGVLRLTYWSKVNNKESLDKAVRNMGVRAAEELGRIAGDNPPSVDQNASRHLRYGRSPRDLALGAVAIFISYSGFRLTGALMDAWNPLYHSDRMTVSDGFERLISLAESHPGLGLDREVLSAAWDKLHQYKSQEDRESWANSHRTRILLAIPGWRTDPGAALKIAEIVGWAGDFDSAMKFYDHAIATQGSNETLFMAHAFKGQYYYELFISAGAAGQTERQRYFAEQAVRSFKNAEQTMGGGWGLAKGFAQMLKQCQEFLQEKP
jgi:O-antigen ligase